MPPISDDLRDYLRQCGASMQTVERCTNETRIYHDLGVYGDIADGYMSVLADQYHVDLSGFRFEEHFPPEFPGGNAYTRTLLWLMPFLGRARRQREVYRPITLAMVERAIRSKRWEA